MMSNIQLSKIFKIGVFGEINIAKPLLYKH